MLSGWKTMIASGVALLAGMAAQYGVVISKSDQTAIALFVVGLAGIVLRHVTTGPAGWRKPPTPPAPPAA